MKMRDITALFSLPKKDTMDYGLPFYANIFTKIEGMSQLRTANILKVVNYYSLDIFLK